MTISYTWTLPNLDQIDLELEYEITEGEKPTWNYPGSMPTVDIVSVRPAEHESAFRAALDSDPELWPHVESECFEDHAESLEYAGD